MNKADFCVDCWCCKKAREKPGSFWHGFVKFIYHSLWCPYCKAYEKETGKNPYEK